MNFKEFGLETWPRRQSGRPETFFSPGEPSRFHGPREVTVKTAEPEETYGVGEVSLLDLLQVRGACQSVGGSARRRSGHFG